MKFDIFNSNLLLKIPFKQESVYMASDFAMS